jgi:agmatine/peptidylarginine deiminase
MERNDLPVQLPAEWAAQSAVMLTWPHIHTDWKPILKEVAPCFVAIAKAIMAREKLIIVCYSIKEVQFALGAVDYSRIVFCEMATNDTWARDHGPVSVWINGRPCILDFTFNGWGLKFPANLDNQITRKLYENKVFNPEVRYQNQSHLVLEGGSIESDGEGTILTTSSCLLSLNRNNFSDRAEAEQCLQGLFQTQQVLWLNHGYLAGDDTDSHIDTLARLCDRETIAYVQCTDENDEHFDELALMEQELKRFKTAQGNPYRLIPLPMARAVYDEGERLPATYANFLIINGAVLAPIYDSSRDAIALAALQKAFPDREIIGINCLPLIKQHGSLHCVTMQIPQGFI